MKIESPVTCVCNRQQAADSRQQSMPITVSNIAIKDLTPKVDDPAIIQLLPKTLFPKQLSFELSGVNNAIANGLRRAIASEILVSALWFEYDDYECTNPFCINTMIRNRIQCMPIDQSTPLDAVFELDYQNKTDNVIDVKSGSIRAVGGGKLPFNETFTLFTLEPGKSIKIKRITIRQDYEYNFAGYCLGFNAVCLPLDQTPINAFEPAAGGISSSVANPTKYRIQFNTNGGMDTRRIVLAACDSIITRVQNVQNILYMISAEDNIYLLTIVGESDTLGNLFMRHINDLYPNIHSVTYTNDPVIRSLELKIICDEDIVSLFGSVIDHIVKQFTAIRAAFK